MTQIRRQPLCPSRLARSTQERRQQESKIIEEGVGVRGVRTKDMSARRRGEAVEKKVPYLEEGFTTVAAATRAIASREMAEEKEKKKKKD
jgi:hypothetical protein